MLIEKAISIKQPWADLIIENIKDIEIRTWNTKHRGLIAIHTGSKFDNDGLKYLQQKKYYKNKTEKDFLKGYIIGYAYLYDTIEFRDKKHFKQYQDRHHNNPDWFTGSEKGFILIDITKTFPMKQKGKLNIYKLDSALEIAR